MEPDGHLTEIHQNFHAFAHHSLPDTPEALWVISPTQQRLATVERWMQARKAHPQTRALTLPMAASLYANAAILSAQIP